MFFQSLQFVLFAQIEQNSFTLCKNVVTVGAAKWDHFDYKKSKRIEKI
jgi:hypothetical protein